MNINGGAALFGGEFGKGGCLTVESPLTISDNAVLRVEIPAAGLPVGQIRLKTPRLTVGKNIKVRVEADDKAYHKGRVTILDWSDTDFTGTAPSDGAFVLDTTSPHLVSGSLILDSANKTLSLAYKLDTARPPLIIIVR